MLAGAGLVVSAAPTVMAPETTVGAGSTNDALFAIESNRLSIVDRIMTSFDGQIKAAASNAATVRASLMGLRADQLLSASLSNSFKDVSLVLAEPIANGPATHRYVTVSPAAALGFVAPEAASSFVLRTGDDLSLATSAELSKANASTRVVGYFVPNAISSVVLSTGPSANERQKDGVGTGSASWIGFVAGSNFASGTGSAVAAGQNNVASGASSFVAAGFANQANGTSSLVIGGFDNRATNIDAMVGAGAGNRATGARSVIVGGGYNLASGNFSFIGGGGRDGTGSAAAGTDTSLDHRAFGKWSTIAGGSGNVTGLNGSGDSVRGDTVAGGIRNTASGGKAFVGGGGCNVASGFGAVIGGGGQSSDTGICVFGNVASGQYSFVGAGFNNVAAGTSSVALGQSAKANETATFVFSDGTAYNSNGASTFNVRASGGLFVDDSTSIRMGATVRQNITLWGNPAATTGSYGIGVQNSNMYFRLDAGVSENGFAYYAGGTHSNTAQDPGVGGTLLATLDRQGSFNLPTSLDQHIRLRTGSGLVQGMGGQTSTTYLRTNGSVGFYLNGTHNDNFVDAGGGSVLATIQNGAGTATVVGNVRALSFTATSDRAAKSSFASVNAKDILAKLAAMPITTWVYNAEKGMGVRHIGPVAQDFAKAFKVGYDDKSISTIDASGVALTAIKGLNELVKEKDAEIAILKREMAAIKKKLGM
jgi:hypothetical protein